MHFRIETARANAILNEYKWFTGILCFQAISVLPIGLYMYYAVSTGKLIETGRISTLFLYLADLIFVFMGFGSFYEQLMIYKYRVSNAEPIEQAFLRQTQLDRQPLSDWQELKIKNLCFRYDQDRSLVHLDNLSLDIKKGDKIAITGESGSGKTTFLKALHGLYPSAQDDFGILKKDLKTMLVPQEPEIFSSTIRENITLGIPYEDSEIFKFAKLAAFDGVIAELPKGLNSVINEKGVNLSGGQKQRLALTRALLFAAEKDFILLDESTSSVDPKNELIIYENILKYFKDKTIIASIHKMNLLPFFDRVFRFEKGKLVTQVYSAKLEPKAEFLEKNK